MASTKPVRDHPLPPTFPGAMMIGEEEKRAVIEVLENQSLFRYYGPKFLSKVKSFEREFAQYMRVNHVLGLTSGTGSLMTALAGISVGPGDEVIIPAYAWIATATSVLASRAIPVIAEVDKSLTLDPRDFEAKISERTKAVIPVHMRGVSSKMDVTTSIAKKHDIKVIEDVAQSCGGSFKGKKLGAIGDVGAYSFQLNKVITAGEGGAITTNDKAIFDRAVMFHDVAGVAREDFWGGFTTQPIIGVNFRMSEITGAILIEQLHKLDKILSVTRRNKAVIKKGISDVKGIEFREIPDAQGDTGISLMFFLPSAEKAQEFAEALRAENIYGDGYGTFVPYIPEKPDWHVYAHWRTILEKRTFTLEGCPYSCRFYTGKISYSPSMCPNTLDLLGRAVHMDVSPLLTEEDIDDIIEGVHKVAASL